MSMAMVMGIENLSPCLRDTWARTHSSELSPLSPSSLSAPLLQLVFEVGFGIRELVCSLWNHTQDNFDAQIDLEIAKPHL